MVKVIDEPDCGNAPRRIIIRDIVLAMVEKRPEVLEKIIDDDIRWHVVGRTVLEGAGQVATWVTESIAVREVRFHTILTHGREGGVDGEVGFSDGTRQSFCHVFGFAGASKTARVKTARSYLVDQ